MVVSALSAFGGGMLWTTLLAAATSVSSIPPFLPVGKVRSGRFGVYATGFLIGPCEALTAHHLDSSPGSLVGRTYRFSIYDPKGRVRTSRARVIASGTFDYASIRADRFDHDWTLLRLDKCFGREVGFFDLEYSDGNTLNAQVSSKALALAGYPAYRWIQLGPRMTVECDAYGLQRETFWHNCFGGQGTSGGPIYTSRNGRLVAVGINVAVVPNQENRNIAVRLDKILPVIRAAIQANGSGPPATPNGTIPDHSAAGR